MRDLRLRFAKLWPLEARGPPLSIAPVVSGESEVDYFGFGGWCRVNYKGQKVRKFRLDFYGIGSYDNFDLFCHDMVTK